MEEDYSVYAVLGYFFQSPYERRKRMLPGSIKEPRRIDIHRENRTEKVANAQIAFQQARNLMAIKNKR